MAYLSDRASKAVANARKDRTKSAAGATVRKNVEAAGIKNLTDDEFKKARSILQPRMRLDRKKTAARAVGIEKMQAKKAAVKRAAAAIGNAPMAKKAAVKKVAKAVVKKNGKK